MGFEGDTPDNIITYFEKVSKENGIDPYLHNCIICNRYVLSNTKKPICEYCKSQYK